MQVAVIGNSTIHGGFAVAADLALAGVPVRLAAWPGAEATLDPIRRRGGIDMRGRIDQSLRGKAGLATPTLCEDIATAVAGAEIIVLDIPAGEYETRFATLLPHLHPGQIAYVNMHGYWPALRLAPLLRDAGLTDVTIAESAAPTHAAHSHDGVLDLQWVRRRAPVGVFPATRGPDVLPRLQKIFPHIAPAKNVLETGFAGLNMMIHFPLVLPNIAWCDRALEAGESVHLYGPGNTAHAGRLADAQDAERPPVCAAYDVPCRSLGDHLRDYYAADGAGVREIVANAEYYRTLPPYPADAWKRWLAADIPHAHVPLAEFAARAGIATPLHDAIITIAGALLGRDFRADGVTLARLGLADCTVDDIKRYVQNGDAPNG